MKHSPELKVFPSRRNHVFLTSIEGTNFVIKEFSNIVSLKLEVSVHKKIDGYVKTPKIFSTDSSCICYEYLSGSTFLELLEEETLNEEILLELILWLQNFYTRTNKILGDAHFRNFIYQDGIYGIDFETTKKGNKEEDLASLILFLLTYYPILSDYKIKLATYLASQALAILSLDPSLFLDELFSCAKVLETRRKVVFLEQCEWEKLFLSFF